MSPVCPVPIMTALMPRSLSALVRIVAVVRLPMAPSVPSTAMRGQVTSAMRPLNMRRSFLARGRRTSRIVTPWSAAAAAISGSSLRNSCRPLTTPMPTLMASRTIVRSAGDSMPLDGAIPKMKTSGMPAARVNASARSPQTGMPLGSWSRTDPASSPERVLSITEMIS
jgi:hypothetical protein